MEKFYYKKNYGQNFINDENIISDIINNSSIDNDTLVIEIGPGMGVLSKELVKVCKNLVMIEIDGRLERPLNNLLQNYDNYELIIGDVLEIDTLSYISKYEYNKLFVVANLPYYITSPILTMITKNLYPDRIVVMVQDEVADRLSALVGNRNYGYSTVYFNSLYDVTKLFRVTRDKFTPSPNVDSAVIRMDKNKKIRSNEDLFDKFIKDCFRYKRKNIKNNLSNYDLEVVEKILKKYGLSLNSRAEDISVIVFDELCLNLIR